MTTQPANTITVQLSQLRRGGREDSEPISISLARDAPLSELWERVRELGFDYPINFHDSKAQVWTRNSTKTIVEDYEEFPVVESTNPDNATAIGLDETLLAYGDRRFRDPFQLNVDVDPTSQHGPCECLLDGRGLKVTFLRTTRMPDDDRLHALPAALGVFPLYNVSAYAASLPDNIVQEGGLFMPMWQREALWLAFEATMANRYAIRVSVGRINAISGNSMDDPPPAGDAKPMQDYVVVPGQDWLDGICVAPGVVRQFVAMPLGSGYTVEGQKTGEEKHGGLQIEFIPAYQSSLRWWTRAQEIPNDRSNLLYSLKCYDHDSPRKLGLAVGDKLRAYPVPAHRRTSATVEDVPGENGVTQLTALYPVESRNRYAGLPMSASSRGSPRHTSQSKGDPTGPLTLSGDPTAPLTLSGSTVLSGLPDTLPAHTPAKAPKVDPKYLVAGKPTAPVAPSAPVPAASPAFADYTDDLPRKTRPAPPEPPQMAKSAGLSSFTKGGDDVYQSSAPDFPIISQTYHSGANDNWEGLGVSDEALPSNIKWGPELDASEPDAGPIDLVTAKKPNPPASSQTLTKANDLDTSNFGGDEYVDLDWGVTDRHHHPTRLDDTLDEVDVSISMSLDDVEEAPDTRDDIKDIGKHIEKMGLAAGGKLMQDIYDDKNDAAIWNTAAARLVNIHIISPASCEAVTHIVPPPPPITAEAYAKQEIPLYVVEEKPDERLDGGDFENVISVSAMDKKNEVDGEPSLDPTKPTKCTTCSIRLCDCIIRPCTHQFCHLCIKALSPTTSISYSTSTAKAQKSNWKCPTCASKVEYVAGFSAPMNLPGEETVKVRVPVNVLGVGDGRVGFRSVHKARI